MAELDRFVIAQDAQGTYDRALAELREGRKVSHWMWFVFPQAAGLGRSDTARYYALEGRDDARAYLAHPVLGPRLVVAAQAVLDSGAATAEALLGAVDALKLCSSMTLFEAAAGAPAAGEAAHRDEACRPDDHPQQGAVAWAVFGAVLERYYIGRRDQETLRRI